jgi:hypothetical protein
MQVTVAQSFFKKIALLEEKVEQRVMEKASDIVTDAVDQSPVHTGAFVESWQINPRGESIKSGKKLCWTKSPARRR